MKQLWLSIGKVRWLAFLLLFSISCSAPVEHDISYTWSPVRIDSDIQGSDQIEAVIAPFRASLDSIMNEVIGYATYDLTVKGQYESTLGTFVTDLMLSQSITSYDKEVDVAMMNHKGGLRAPINEGPITVGEIFKVMPFENEVILLEINGSILLEVIEFINESNRTMIWPVGFQVTESGIKNVLINGEEIALDRNYTLAVSDYQANGGGGFNMLKPLKRLEIAPLKLRDMIMQEIRQLTAKGDSIKAEVANLITVSDQ